MRRIFVSLFSLSRSIKKQDGFSLIEIIVGSAIFAIIAVSVYQSYASLIALVSASRVKITATDLINEQFELIRNLPYDKVGIAGGIPDGVLENSEIFVRDNGTFTIIRTVRNIDDPFDGVIGGSPNDLSPADYKLVEIEVNCDVCKNFVEMSVTSRVSPKNLETASTNGALFIRVFDANGNPVPNADVHVENNLATTSIIIDDITDNQGMLQIVDAPPGINAYEIMVSKSGYTTDETYTASVGNPNPTKPHATVLLQQVTQVSFVIDKISTVNISTLTDDCTAVGNIPFSMVGAKLIGTNPDVYKYSANHSTNSGGLKTISQVEWDTYNLTVSDSTYHLAGVNPLLPVSILPDAAQDIQLILTTKNPSHLLVTVKDNSNGLPLSGADVTLTKTGYTDSLITGRGFLKQSDWSGGPGQDDFIDKTRYNSSDGNIDINNPVGEIKLTNIFGDYAPSGALFSSIFDTGTTTNFNQIIWNPASQSQATGPDSVLFQFASDPLNNASTTWEFLGPDGTGSTFYSIADTNINSIHNGDRYFRYKSYLATASSTLTPNIAEVAFTFTSECTPPGQVLFSSLSGGTYTLSVDKSGYGSYQNQIIIPNDVSFLQHEVDLVTQ